MILQCNLPQNGNKRPDDTGKLTYLLCPPGLFGIYFFTLSYYHILSLPSRTWTAHGYLISLFPGLPAATLKAAYGVSWEGHATSDFTFLTGSFYYIYTINNSTGTITPDSANPGIIPWNITEPYVPSPVNVIASYVALENDDGWVDCSPHDLCGASSYVTGPYSGILTLLNRMHIMESGSCFEFCDEMFLTDFPPFGVSGAPTTNQIDAMAYANGTLYVVTRQN